MNQSDTENLTLIYEDILEEGWKSKAMGLAAAGAGAMALFPSKGDDDINKKSERIGASIEQTQDTRNARKNVHDLEKIKNLTMKYLDQIGHDYDQVIIKGDQMIIKSSKNGDSYKNLLKLKQDILYGSVLNNKAGLEKFLINNL
jgi:hypothetical protein